jgi:hypothetical protein
MGKYLTADDILHADDFVFADVDCPEWGGTVHIRSLSGGQRVTLKKALDAGNSDIDEMLCVMCIVDEDGNRIFDRKQIGELSRKNTKAISRVAIRALEISGMRNPDKAVADAEKNSDATRSEGSSFD